MDFIWLFWPNSIYSLLPWKTIEKLRYKESPLIPVIGENPFYENIDYAWYMDTKTVFPHTKRHRAMRAICKNELIELKKALDEGFDIDAPVDLEKERTALGLAAFLNRPHILQYLILRGAQIDKPDKFGNTPLIDSVERVNMECMISLVENGADISKKNMFLQNSTSKAELKDYHSIRSYLEKQSQLPERSIKLPQHTIRFKFEDMLKDENMKAKRYSKGHTYIFYSLTKAYSYSMYTDNSDSL